MPGLEARLDRFEEAFAQGRRRAAFEAAVEVWRCSRTEAVASWIDRLADSFCERTPFDLGSAKKFQDAWVAAARGREPFELRFLVRELVRYANARSSSKDMAFITASLQELGPKTEDPSVVAATLELCRTHWSFQSWDRTRLRWLKWIAEVRDPRCLEPLGRFAHHTDWSGPMFGTDGDVVAQRMIDQIRAQAPGVLSPGDSNRLSALVGRMDSGLPARANESLASTAESVEELFARVSADPDDRELRAVWADALQQRGDPRGEIVSLGLAARDDPKARALLDKRIAKEWRQWLGPAAASVVKSTLEFEDGLLAACTVHAKSQSAADILFGHPIWQTVRRLTFTNFGRITSNMVWLEEAYGAKDTALVDLATITLPRLRTLEVDFGTRDFTKKSKGVAALAGARGLPRLQRLLLRSNQSWRLRAGPELRELSDVLGHFEWVFDASWSSQLEELAFPADVLRLTAGELTMLLHRVRRLPKVRIVSVCDTHYAAPNTKTHWGPVIDLERHEMSFKRQVEEDPAGVEYWRAVAANLRMPFRDANASA